jgi:phosphoesterase RecJ-like protein
MSSLRTPAPDPEGVRALALLRSGRSFLLAGHVRPDGDCLGAEAALARVLGALGKRARILNPDPLDPRFDFLEEAATFHAYEGGPLPEHDVAVLLDINTLTRCGELGLALAAAPSKKLVVDHHVASGGDEPWWDAAFVDAEASATGLLVWRIARALEVEVDRTAATAIFTSIVTDTGWFRHSNTDAETMAVAAELVARGVEPNRLFARIFQREHPGLPRALGKLLARTEYLAGGRLALVDQPKHLADEALVDGDPVLDLLRSVGPVEVVLYLRETEAGDCRLSARSKSDFDVQALARRFGGGGHKKAAGATLEGPLERARERLIAAALEDLGARASAGADGDRR